VVEGSVRFLCLSSAAFRRTVGRMRMRCALAVFSRHMEGMGRRDRQRYTVLPTAWTRQRAQASIAATFSSEQL
jgi:hypothetical protein